MNRTRSVSEQHTGVSPSANTLPPRPIRPSLKRLGTISSITFMLTGVVMVCQPFFHFLFQWGFLVTLTGIIAFTIASNLSGDRDA